MSLQHARYNSERRFVAGENSSFERQKLLAQRSAIASTKRGEHGDLILNFLLERLAEQLSSSFVQYGQKRIFGFTWKIDHRIANFAHGVSPIMSKLRVVGCQSPTKTRGPPQSHPHLLVISLFASIQILPGFSVASTMNFIVIKINERENHAHILQVAVDREHAFRL